MTDHIREQNGVASYSVLLGEWYNGEAVGLRNEFCEYYYRDNLEAPNVFGLGSYKGFIGDIFFSSCFREDWSIFIHPQPDCPGCTVNPIHPDDTHCRLDCNGDRVCLDACDEDDDGEVHIMIVDDCDGGSHSTYLTGDFESGDPNCDTCHNECPSCRYPNTCYTCDDTLCAVCTVYAECEVCVDNTIPSSYVDGCECLPDYNHDTVNHACCHPTCVRCY